MEKHKFTHPLAENGSLCPPGFQTDKLPVDNRASEVKVRRRPEIHLLRGFKKKKL